MGAGIPPSLLMQDMYRHLPEKLHQWYLERTRGEGDVRVKICMSLPEVDVLRDQRSHQQAPCPTR